MKTLLGLNTTELEQIALSMGLDAYRGRQLATWMYRKGAGSFEEMTDLGKELREELIQRFEIRTIQTKDVKKQQDGTAKYLLQLSDDELIEAVFIPHRQWETVCVSTQIGCPIGCRFCASGKDFKRNLTAAEIIEQVLIGRGKKNVNVVFMGIGEPFLNNKELFRAFKILNSEVGIGARHLTVSTIGIIDGINKLANFGMEVNLAVSLHAPENGIRRQLIKADLPKVREILGAAEAYFQKTGRRVSIEYVMLSEINDQQKHASGLARLLQSYDFKYHVNLIPYNQTEAEFVSSSPDQIRAFLMVLEEYGVNATIRKERGNQIQAACGQLRHQQPEGDTDK